MNIINQIENSLENNIYKNTMKKKYIIFNKEININLANIFYQIKIKIIISTNISKKNNNNIIK